jgi:hypothetical protein
MNIICRIFKRWNQLNTVQQRDWNVMLNVSKHGGQASTHAPFDRLRVTPPFIFLQ